ncbi:ECF transporter S component [Chloroflexota bacterium]
MKPSRLILAMGMIIAAAALVMPALDIPLPGLLLNWGVISAVLVILTCLAFFLEFEAAAMSSKEIALVAMLGTISAVLRVPFAAIPSVQPCTYLIICTGFVFGPVAGFTVGAITAIVSNFFLAQGPWTLYQMVAWGLAGASAGYLGRLNVNRIALIIFGALWGYFFGWITNIWYWTALVYPLTINTFIVTQLSTVWFDTMHATGNAVFLGALGMRTIAILQRFKGRFSVEYSVS